MLAVDPVRRVIGTDTEIRPESRKRLRPGWPLAALLCLYPLWWALGIGEFTFILFAIPMARSLLRTRPIRVPPGFGVWLLFLMWTLLSLLMLAATAPGTRNGSGSGRAIATGLRLLQLAAMTIILLYTGNLSRRDVSQRRMMKWLSVLFISTVVGGLFALMAPNFSFTSPLELILPAGIRSNAYVHALAHPALAQVQAVLGYASPRPSAPWPYTNTWGNVLSILVIWFSIWAWSSRRRHSRLIASAVLAVALIPIVYSLNRTMWIGLILSVGYLIARLARRGDFRATLIAGGAVLLGGVLFLVTPLHSVVSARASNGQSNTIRAFLDSAAIHGAVKSPILGWGGPRKSIGSAQSVAIGSTPSCPNCGGVTIGSTGDFWLIVFSQGFVGAGLYIGYLLTTMWRFRRERGAISSGGRLVVGLGLLYMLSYDGLPAAQGLTMVSIALMWREWLAVRELRPARDAVPHALAVPAPV
jgi:hypothetical protein